MTNPLPEPELLRKILRYDAGRLFWRKRPVDMFPCLRLRNSWNAKYASKEAFTSDNGYGYRIGSIFGKTYKAHRVIWTMAHNEWPSDQIDHINGVKDDNRLENLRSVTRQENMRNQKRRCDNISGVTGVLWHKSAFKWRAQIWADGRVNYLGIFKNKSDAIAARKAAEIEQGYHPNHGRKT